MVFSPSMTSRNRIVLGNFQPRSNIDFATIREKLREEHGPSCTSDAETSRKLADVDKDIEDCEALVLDVQSEIHRLQAEVIFLQNYHQRLESYKTALESLRMPIRMLPNEILLRIFEYACGVNDLTSRNLRDMPALVISGVCSHWRSLSQSHSDLWCCIRIRMSEIPRYQSLFFVLDRYLVWSRESPLSLELTGKRVEALEPHHLAVCARLSRCSRRWKKLQLLHLNVYDALVTHDTVDLPVLEELIVPCIWFTNSEDLNQFRNAPKLHTVSFSRMHLADLHKAKLPWEQLKVLDIAQFEKGTNAIFELCVNLKALHFRQFENDAIESCFPPLMAQNVETLSISLSQTMARQQLANVIFRSISCPYLTSLFIEKERGTEPYNLAWPREELKFFTTYSAFQLTTLSIRLIPLSDTDLIDLLRRIPSLVHLFIDDSLGQSPITLHLMQTLHAFPPPSPVIIPSALVPRLQSLTLTSNGSEKKEGSFTDQAFVEMVISRWFPSGIDTPILQGGTVCLRSVVLKARKRSMNEEVYRPLRYLEEAGMRVVVIGKNYRL